MLYCNITGMPTIQQQISTIYEQDSRQVLASLIRLMQGNFDLAEEALQDAFTAALAQWPRDGIPDNPGAWLISTGRFKAIDRLRKRARYDDSVTDIAERLASEPFPPENWDTIEDDQLRLIFTCCHPSLSPEARLALTLREVCNLTTEQIAAAFLVPVPTLAQRIVRAKSKIRDAGIPYEVPDKEQLPERLDSVLQAIYLVFNEGYSASAGDTLARHELSAEAIRLARLLMNLLPETEVTGLLALMLLHHARQSARTTAQGDLIPLEDQDRTLWNREQIREGCALVVQALQSPGIGPYSLQAAIAAVHAEAPSATDTDWRQITGLYDILLNMTPTPVVALNRAVAIAMRDGPEAGLAVIDTLKSHGELENYHLFHAAQADLHRRLGQTTQAREHYRQAIELAEQEPERRYLQRRLEQLEEKK